MTTLINLQCQVRAQANFLELLENKTVCLIENFGDDSKQVKENLENIAKYKIELIQLERNLESWILADKGVNIKEPSKLALLVNDYITNINNLVLSGDIENSRKAVMAYLDDNYIDIALCGDSRVGDMLTTHYLSVFENGVIVDTQNVNNEVEEEVNLVIEQLQYDVKSYYVPFSKAEMLSYIETIKHDNPDVLRAVRSHFYNIANKIE